MRSLPSFPPSFLPSFLPSLLLSSFLPSYPSCLVFFPPGALKPKNTKKTQKKYQKRTPTQSQLSVLFQRASTMTTPCACVLGMRRRLAQAPRGPTADPCRKQPETTLFVESHLHRTKIQPTNNHGSGWLRNDTTTSRTVLGLDLASARAVSMRAKASRLSFTSSSIIFACRTSSAWSWALSTAWVAIARTSSNYIIIWVT